MTAMNDYLDQFRVSAGLVLTEAKLESFPKLEKELLKKLVAMKHDWKIMEYVNAGRQIGGYGMGDPFEPPEYEEWDMDRAYAAYTPTVTKAEEGDGEYYVTIGFAEVESSKMGKVLPKRADSLKVNRYYRDKDEGHLEEMEKLGKELEKMVKTMFRKNKVELEEVFHDDDDIQYHFSVR